MTAMFELNQISLDDLPREPGVNVLRAAEAAVWQDGYRFLAAVRRAAAQVNEIARKTYAVEYARGFAEGRMAGADEAARLVSETTLKVDRHLTSLEREIGALALNVVRRVLGELDAGELIARAAAQAVGEFRREKWLKVTVHPAVADRVRTALATLAQDGGPTVTVESDVALDERACIVASDFAVVDASLEAQLQAFTAAFAAGQRDVEP
jgi:type III secretion protein L